MTLDQSLEQKVVRRLLGKPWVKIDLSGQFGENRVKAGIHIKIIIIPHSNDVTGRGNSPRARASPWVQVRGGAWSLHSRANEQGKNLSIFP